MGAQLPQIVLAGFQERTVVLIGEVAQTPVLVVAGLLPLNPTLDPQNGAAHRAAVLGIRLDITAVCHFLAALGAAQGGVFKAQQTSTLAARVET